MSLGNNKKSIGAILNYYISGAISALFVWGTATSKKWGEATTQTWGG
jgi:hypothetical protein